MTKNDVVIRYSDNDDTDLGVACRLRCRSCVITIGYFRTGGAIVRAMKKHQREVEHTKINFEINCNSVYNAAKTSSARRYKRKH